MNDFARYMRLKSPCRDCPFSTSAEGTRMRDSLAPGRMRGIARGLEEDDSTSFCCHKTHQKSEAVCAGAMGYLHKRGMPGIAMRLALFNNTLSINDLERMAEKSIDNV